MITDYIGGEGSAETPKNDYVIYGWPLIAIILLNDVTSFDGGDADVGDDVDDDDDEDHHHLDHDHHWLQIAALA